jgi:deoxyribodipyrimidine photo-lyase
MHVEHLWLPGNVVNCNVILLRIAVMFQRNLDIDRRARLLAPGKRGKGPVVCWLSREQRLADNWTLLWAQQEALDRQTGLLVVFCLIPDYPGANLRHYLFMLKGLTELRQNLRQNNIPFVILPGSPPERLPSLLKNVDAQVLVCDFDPLRLKRQWQQELCSKLHLPFYEVDGHNIIPAWIVSQKKEFGAYTLRPKIGRLLDQYLTEIPKLQPHPYSTTLVAEQIDHTAILSSIADKSVNEVTWLVPGEKAGQQQLARVLTEILPHYATARNDPTRKGQSDLSPYLHFGQLSPQRVALLVKSADLPVEAKAAFLEELIVRRELADNFCLYEPKYDSFAGFPSWAQKTLDEHRADPRPYCYDGDRFEEGTTHSKLWNSCQQELRQRGKLHGYLRMYWAKKILEWSKDPEEAMATAIRLNDRYSLDGRDPNGYAGIAWSIGGVHDRAWKERPIFGKIRYMNENGCRRKFAVPEYIAQVSKNTMPNKRC